MKHLFSKFNIMVSRLNPSKVLLGLGFSLCIAMHAHAGDFRSILPAKAITYDAPSAASKKLFIMNHGYPVEIIVNLGEWVKVRDQLSGLSWIEGKDLDTKRTVLVTDNTDIKEAEGADSKLLATVEKDVVLELVSPNINNGWVKVKHQGGIVGYIQSSAIWGLY
ncbi:MAG: SH3 domain-containing protein [Methylophilaceae bacterium]